MQRSTIIAELIHYLANDVLDGQDIGLDENTPLLEWGIINSIEIIRLLNFVRTQFALDIPPETIVPENFINLTAISDLLLKLASEEKEAVEHSSQERL